jgi:hypothetical protein
VDDGVTRVADECYRFARWFGRRRTRDLRFLRPPAGGSTGLGVPHGIALLASLEQHG